MASTDYPLILIVGYSGSGKSYSLRNLNPVTTRILNIERKILPFREQTEFAKNSNILDLATIQAFDQALDAALKNEKLDVIVIESATKYFELLLTFAKSCNKGYDIYNFFNDRVTMFLERIKSNKSKFVILLATDERVQLISPTGAESSSRRVKIAGKQWEGVVEKEFTIVLFTEVKQDKDKKSIYSFITNNDGTNSAKAPPDMFKGQVVNNDVMDVVKTLSEYYSLPLINSTKVEIKQEIKQVVDSIINTKL